MIRYFKDMFISVVISKTISCKLSCRPFQTKLHFFFVVFLGIIHISMVRTDTTNQVINQESKLLGNPKDGMEDVERYKICI